MSPEGGAGDGDDPPSDDARSDDGAGLDGAGSDDGAGSHGEVLDVAWLLRSLAERSVTVATAESLTAGSLSARLADVPGASAVLRGGVVAYATPIKESLLGVDGGLLVAGGAVQQEVAVQMAAGVARLFGASLGVATTGVAGPDQQDGREVGTVFVAVAGGGHGGALVAEHRFGGDRAAVRASATAAALRLLARWARERAGRTGR